TRSVGRPASPASTRFPAARFPRTGASPTSPPQERRSASAPRTRRRASGRREGRRQRSRSQSADETRASVWQSSSGGGGRFDRIRAARSWVQLVHLSVRPRQARQLLHFGAALIVVTWPKRLLRSSSPISAAKRSTTGLRLL